MIDRARERAGRQNAAAAQQLLLRRRPAAARDVLASQVDDDVGARELLGERSGRPVRVPGDGVGAAAGTTRQREDAMARGRQAGRQFPAEKS